MLEDNQIFIIVDIEADGPVAGLYSMLSIGAVATTEIGEVSAFYRTIEPLENASQLPRTMEWWRTQPEAWKEVTSHAQSPEKVMQDFCAWLDELGKLPVFVAHPTAFDYAFVSWYVWKFAQRNPFTDEDGAQLSLDLTSYISGKFELSLKNAKRSNLPDWMTVGMPKHSHNALDDARGYGVILRNILKNPL